MKYRPGAGDNGLGAAIQFVCADKTHHWVVAAHAIQGLGG